MFEGTDLISVKHRCVKVSGVARAVNSELKMVAHVNSEKEPDSSKKVAKNTIGA